MNIAETIAFDKAGQPEQEPSLARKLFLSLVILLVAALSFGIGRLTSVSTGQGIKIEYDPDLQTASAVQATQALPVQGGSVVVASKNGSKYHYLHCPGAKQIKEMNKITFVTPEAAEAAGYTLAGNCLPR